jgi:hypothetical protein
MEVSGQRHAPAALCPRSNAPGTHWTGRWVGPTAGLGTDVRLKNPLASVVDRTSISRSSSP